MGSSIFSFIAVPLGWIMWACYKILPVYGVSLILFTIITKALMFPLSINQQKNTAKMAIFQPKMNELQKKYSNNKQKYQEELSKLYQEEGYNPLSGCLPLLIQFPILFGLIDVIYKPITHVLRFPADVIAKAVEIAKTALGDTFIAASPEISVAMAVSDPAFQTRFTELGADFITKVSAFDLNFLGINLGLQPSLNSFNILWLIPILSGVTSYLLTIYTMRSNPAQQQQGGMGKAMMYVMPLFSIFFAFQVPAGVGFYWILTNFLMAFQTYILNKMYDPKALAAKVAEEMKLKKQKKKNSKFSQAYQKSMEEARQKVQDKQKGAVKNTETEAEPDSDTSGEGTEVTETKKEKPAASPKREKGPTAKEINRAKLAEARKRDAEKYGEVYVEPTDDDVN